ncbi:MAG: BON domain-containing protein, partial [Thermohalobaculum sp.]|nr:BON domain-containing protein [Thermohalobaculum sp.]
MRSILIFAVLATVGVLAWHASMVVAPRIERGIDGRVEAALGRDAVHPLGITTHGRVVRLSGLADSEAARAGLVRRAAAVPGVGGVVDALSVLPVQVPYRFAAHREAGQPLRIDGTAPSAAAETLILDRARAIATGHTLQSALVLAAGAPGEGWADSVGRGLGALGALAEGAIEITGRQAHLGGRAASEEVRAAIVAQLAADPLLDWQIAVTLITPRAEPYRFRAETAPDGARFGGHAPDEVVRA